MPLAVIEIGTILVTARKTKLFAKGQRFKVTSIDGHRYSVRRVFRGRTQGPEYIYDSLNDFNPLPDQPKKNGQETPKTSAVDHPRHYNTHPSGVECITVVEHMGFNLGNAVKYIWRADEKGAAVQDLKKAAWYIEREIQKRTKGKLR